MEGLQFSITEHEQSKGAYEKVPIFADEVACETEARLSLLEDWCRRIYY